MAHIEKKEYILSRLFRTSGMYLGANLINKSLIFLLLPILTHYLTPDDYGIVVMFEVTLAILLPIVGLNVHGFVSIKYFQDKDNFAGYVGNVLVIVTVSVIVVTAIFYIFDTSISHISGVPVRWLVVIPLVAASQCMIDVLLVIWQSKTMAVSYGLFRIIQTITELTLSLLFVVIIGMKWSGRLNGLIIATSSFGLIALYIMHKNRLINIKINKQYIRNILFFGLPLIPHTISAWSLNMFDRFMIKTMLGTEATGIYSVGYQIGMIILLLASSFNAAWSPFLFENLNNNGSDLSLKLKIVKLSYVFFGGILLAAIILGLLAPWFIHAVIGNSFAAASQYVTWIAVGCAFNGMYYLVANYFFYVHKTHILAGITFSMALFNIGLTYIFVKINGALGAAHATFVTYFFFFVITWMLSNKIYRMPWLLVKAQ